LRVHKSDYITVTSGNKETACSGVQEAYPCPSAAVQTPADGQGINAASIENYPSQTNHKSMAVSVAMLQTHL
jgi:hypothetical protein